MSKASETSVVEVDASRGDALAEQLSRLWEEGQAPELDSYLSRVGPLTPAALAQVVLADQRQRWRFGQPRHAEEYLKKFPALSTDRDLAIDVIYNEFLVCEREGLRPDVHEYCRRFPVYTDILRQQIELHQAMALPIIPDASSATLHDSATQSVARWPKVPGYEVVTELGRGGMGVVYRARHIALKRNVALKMLIAGPYAAPEHRQRLYSEAEAVARLQHPNIVQIFEIGTVDGCAFLALELVEGGTLRSRMTGTSYPGREAAELVESLARAVDYAHRNHVIHRDLKPANILLQIADCQLRLDGAEGNRENKDRPPLSPLPPVETSSNLLAVVPKISDFGLAKQVSQEAGIADAGDATQTGTVLGTPCYMAPEQAVGKPAQVGPAVDVYALGAILYELVTGRPPFRGQTPLDTLQQVMFREPTPPSRVQPRLPRDLDAICLKCLEKEPDRRYASAAALAEDLRRFQVGAPVSVRTPSAPERAWRWCRRYPRWAAMFAIVAVLLIVIAVGASILSLERTVALERALAAELDAKHGLLDSQIAQASATLSRRPGQRFETLAVLDRAARLAQELGAKPERFQHMRRIAISALARPDMYPEEACIPLPQAGSQASFDDRLETFAVSDGKGVCSVRRVVDGSELCTIAHAGSKLLLSGDGRCLATMNVDPQEKFGAAVWRLAGGAPAENPVSREKSELSEFRADLVIEETNVFTADFDKAVARVAFAHRNGAISVYDLKEERPQRICRLEPDRLWVEPVIAFHPTRPLVALASYYVPAIQIWDVISKKMVKSVDVPGGCSHIAWHPRGEFLAASPGSGPAIHVFDGRTYERRFDLGPIAGGARLQFNLSGSLLATFDWSGALRLFDVGTRGLLANVPSAGQYLLGLQFSPDDRVLAGFSRNGMLGFWNVATGREYRTFQRHSSPGRALPANLNYLDAAISPDGKLLAMAMSDTAGIWDMATGRQLGLLPVTGAWCVRFGGNKELITVDATGTYSWPMRWAGSVLALGPPRAQSLPPGRGFELSRDGRVQVTRARAVGPETPFAGAWILRQERPDSPLPIDPGTDIGYVAVSPDGTKVVTVDYKQGTVKVWDAGTGRMDRVLLKNGGGAACFSPDGRRLAVGGGDGRLFDVADWAPQQKLGAYVRFHPDEQIVAVADSHKIRILDIATGREIAQLEDPNLDVAEDFSFTRDGALLLVRNPMHGVHVWDLTLIQQQLAARRLEWSIPAGLTGAGRETNQDGFASMNLDTGAYARLSQRVLRENYDRAVEAAPQNATRRYFRAQLYQDDGQLAQAMADLEKAVTLSPNYILACNDLAWLYATGPEKLRDAKKAVTLAERAVQFHPGVWGHLNTLGVSYYRADRLADAARTLQASLKASAGQSDAFDLYFLAMCQHRLDQKEQARHSLQRACAWHERHQQRLSASEYRQLQEFRNEAQKLIDIP